MLNALPAVLYFGGNYKRTIFPFIAFVAFFQLIAFGLPVYFIRIDSFQMNELLNLDAMRIGFWGLLIFYCTYFFFYSYSFQRLKPYSSIPKSLDPGFFNTLIFVMLGIYVFAQVFQLNAIKHLGNFSLYVYIGFTVTKLLRRRANLWETLIFIGVMGFELVDRVTSGLIAELAILLLFLSLIVILEGSRKYLLAVFIIPFAIFYVQFSAVKGDYRNMAWFGKKQLNYEEKVALMAELIEKNEKKMNYDDKEGKDNSLWRFSYPMAALSLVVTKTPDPVPYWDGVSYLPLFTKFIPRALWPDKPEENMGQKFGKTYKVIKQRDNATSINTPIMTEIFMNFGERGFYIGMFILGLFFIFLDKFFNSRAVSYDNQIVNMSIIFPLMIMESNFSLVFGNIFLISISLILLFRMVKR